MNFLPFFELRKTCSLELQENSKEEPLKILQAAFPTFEAYARKFAV